MKQPVYILLMLTLLSALIFPAAAQERDSERNTERNEERSGDRQHRREARRTQGALLYMERTDFDLGDIARRGGEVTTTVSFRNDGTAPLVLIRVTTTCSCLKCDYSKRPVPVGGRGEIRLTYQPLKADPGTFHKVVHILSNSSSGREIITIRGNSLDK